MDDPDPSWYLGSYDETIQEAYRILTEPPLNLEELYPPPFDKALEGKLYHLLHDVLCEFPECFAAIVPEIIPPSQARSVGGSLNRIVPPIATCLLMLQKELTDLRAERDRAKEEDEQDWYARALDAGHTDESFWLAAPESDHSQPDVEMKPNFEHAEEEEKNVDAQREVMDDGAETIWAAAREAAPTPLSRNAGLSAINRLSDQPIMDTVKRQRVSCTKLSRPEVHLFPRATHRSYARTTSNVSASSTSTFSRTNSASTTASVPTTSLTTPAGSFFAPSRNNSTESGGIKLKNKWTPREALPADERRVLCTAFNPLQAQFRRFGIRFEVQWEMERMLARHESVSWTDFKPSHLQMLTGNAEDILPRLGDIVRQITADTKGIESALPAPTLNPRRTRIWREMDKEEEIIRSGKLSSGCEGKLAYTIIARPCEIRDSKRLILGDMTPPPEIPPTQIAPPDRRENSLLFTMTLCEPDMPGKSFRLARRFGSRRIISVKLKVSKLGSMPDAMKLFEGRILEVCGLPFRAVWAPHDRDSVFAVEVGDPGPIVRSPMDMPTFAELFATLPTNGQVRLAALVGANSRWAARPQILFSDSNAATIVAPSAITVIPDIVSASASSYEEATTEQILTDGCGHMSESLAQRLRLDRSDIRPCVVQMRLGGTKGLLTVMSPSQQERFPGKEVVLRDSMVKALSDPLYAHDPSLLTVDVVRYGYLRIGTTLSSEAIVGMRHNGVPAKTFIEMMTKGLDELRDAFLPTMQEGESREDVLCRLVTSCYRFGGIGAERKKRVCVDEGISLRAMGLSDRVHQNDEEGKVDGLDGLVHESEQYAVDPVSGQPGSIAEALMMALMAGFDPLESNYTCIKLHHLVSTISENMIRNFRIPVERSISAFIVPDSQGILRPDEVFISFSTNCPLDPETQSPITHLLGPVLALRSPCKLPTDIRKFTAVYRPELAHLKDCIVMSAHSKLCERSPASFLGGGDYDGDIVQMFWDPALVDAFTNSDAFFADLPADFVEANFKRDVITVEDFHATLARESADDETVIANQQYFLLRALKGDRSTGNYSDLHGNAVYKLGYDHPETIRLARMFCHVLDSRKSGLSVKPSVRRADELKYGGQLAWRSWKKNLPDTDKNEVTRNARRLGTFILDDLMDAGKAYRGKLMVHFPEQTTVYSSIDHRELSAMWLRVKDQPHLQDEVHLVSRHVEACFEIYTLIRQIDGSIIEAYRKLQLGGKPALSFKKRQGQMTPSKGKRKGDQKELTRLTRIRQLAEVWHDELTTSHVPHLCLYGDEGILRRMKISCGATMQKFSPKLVFEMDFATTCAIKASSRGEIVSVLHEVAECLKPSWSGRSGVDV